jgi:hypothetical protein
MNELVDDTMEYLNSETVSTEDVMEIKAETTHSLSKYFDTQKLKQSVSLEVDTSSISLNSSTIDDTPSTNYEETTTTTTTTTSIESLTSKKSVHFHDFVQIFDITDLPVDTDDDQYYDWSLKKDTVMDHTDSTESETSTSISLNSVDDSDRDSVTKISEVFTATASSSSSLMKQRYGHCLVVQRNVEIITGSQRTKKLGHQITATDAPSLYFL